MNIKARFKKVLFLIKLFIVTRGRRFARSGILFLNHYPTDIDRKDGYFARVLKIDEFLKRRFRVYINDSRDAQLPSINKKSDNCIEIKIPAANSVLKRIIIKILGGSYTVYSHGMGRLLSPFALQLFRNARFAVWDIHGAVPEEQYNYRNLRDKDRLDEFYRVEKSVFDKSNVVIGVTNSMLKHIVDKHDDVTRKHRSFINLPIFSTSLINKATTKAIHKKPKIIYSGGLQQWQQVDKMLHFVMQNKDKFEFVFLVPEPHLIVERYKSISNDEFPGLLKSVSPDEIDVYYQDADFGLLLREDNIVNHVACPTKLIDYLSFDIIPIFDAPYIGDFYEGGIKFLSYKGMPTMNLSQVSLGEMKASNRQLLQTIIASTQSGKERLVELLEA